MISTQQERYRTTDGGRIDASEQIVMTGAAHPAAVSRVSWRALLAGLVAAMSLQMLLSTLGMAIGLTTLETINPSARGEAIGIGAGIWWLITGLVSLFVGGWVAGRVAGVPHRDDSMLHGFLTWALAAVVGATLLATAVGGVFGGAMAALNNRIALHGDVNVNDQRASLDFRTNDRLSAGQANSAQVDMNVNAGGDRATVGAQDGERAIDNAKPVAWWTFIALILGAGVATLGGHCGCPRSITAVPVAG